jgi:hypothetical protein
LLPLTEKRFSLLEKSNGSATTVLNDFLKVVCNHFVTGHFKTSQPESNENQPL